MKRSWIKEFEKRFGKWLYGGKAGGSSNEIISFIQSLLLSQHKERVERLQKMKVKFIEKEFYGSETELDKKISFEVSYNQAIDDIIKQEQSLYGEKEEK